MAGGQHAEGDDAENGKDYGSFDRHQPRALSLSLSLSLIAVSTLCVRGF
jgi:hypothetical protein